jgi:hypothetical protein
MSSTAAIRLQIETKLANRVPAALTLKIKQTPELFTTGICEVDAILGGGIPRGSITEVAGTASTGKTSFGLSALAAGGVSVSDTVMVRGAFGWRCFASGVPGPEAEAVAVKASPQATRMRIGGFMCMVLSAMQTHPGRTV